MGFNDDLCRRARELYGWEVKFAGYFRSGSRIDVADWIAERDTPSISIGVEQMNRRLTYGFVEEGQTKVFLYQPFAAVYAEREQDYQQELIEAAFLHLQHSISGKSAQITFPLLLQRYIRPSHLALLEKSNEKAASFDGKLVKIYRRHETKDLKDILRDLKVVDRLQD